MRNYVGPLAVACAITLAGAICFVATYCRFGSATTAPTLIAIALTLTGCLPPFAVAHLLHNGPTRQLAIVGWRFGTLLPALLLMRYWEGDQRNCFFIALLACYFVALPLESWLLIRDLRRSSES